MSAPDHPASAHKRGRANAVFVEVFVDVLVVEYLADAGSAQPEVGDDSGGGIAGGVIRDPVILRQELQEVRAADHGKVILLAVGANHHGERNGFVLLGVAVGVLPGLRARHGNGRAVVGNRDIRKHPGVPMAVDLEGERRHGRVDGGYLAPTRGHEDGGNHAAEVVYVLDGVQTGVGARAVVSTDNIRAGNGGRGDGVVGDIQRGASQSASRQLLDDNGFLRRVVNSGVVRALHLFHGRCVLGLHNDCVQDRVLAVRNGNPSAGRGSGFRGHGGRPVRALGIQHVNHHQRANASQFQENVHRFAQGVFRPIVAVSEVFLCFGDIIDEDGLVHVPVAVVVRQKVLNGGGADEHHGALAFGRYAGADCLLIAIRAMQISHRCVLLIQVIFRFGCSVLRPRSTGKLR